MDIRNLLEQGAALRALLLFRALTPENQAAFLDFAREVLRFQEEDADSEASSDQTAE